MANLIRFGGGALPPNLVVNATKSSSTFTDTGYRQGTLTVSVKNEFGNVIAGLLKIVFSIRAANGTEYSMAGLEGLGWTVTFTGNGDGTYTIAIVSTQTFTGDWDVIVEGVEVETNLVVTFG